MAETPLGGRDAQGPSHKEGPVSDKPRITLKKLHAGLNRAQLYTPGRPSRRFRRAAKARGEA